MKDTDLSINDRIRKVRKAKNLKQKDFALAIKMSRTNISRIESNHIPVNERVISLICMIYDVNVKWLKNGEGEMFEKEKNDRLDKVIQKFKKLDENSQEFILAQIDLIMEYRKKDKKQKSSIKD